MTQSYLQIDSYGTTDMHVEVPRWNRYLFRLIALAACVGLALYFWPKIPCRKSCRSNAYR